MVVVEEESRKKKTKRSRRKRRREKRRKSWRSGNAILNRSTLALFLIDESLPYFFHFYKRDFKENRTGIY